MSGRLTFVTQNKQTKDEAVLADEEVADGNSSQGEVEQGSPFSWSGEAAGDKKTVDFKQFEGKDGESSGWARRHTAVTFTSGVNDMLSPTYDHQGRRLSDGPLSAFERSARKEEYFDDTTPVKDVKNPLPRIVDLLPRIKELNNEISAHKRVELELITTKNQLTEQRDFFESAFNEHRASAVHNMEREERTARDMIIWAWQEVSSALRYAAVATEPDTIFISTPFQSSSDLRKALALEKSGSPSSPTVMLRAHRGSWEWEMVEESEQVTAAKSLQEKEELSAKLATAYTRISQLEVSLLAKEGIIVSKNQELEKADGKICDLTATVDDVKLRARQEKEKEREKEWDREKTKSASPSPFRANFESNKFRPYSSANAEAQAPMMFCKLNSTGITSPRDASRSRSAPNDRERSASAKRRRNTVSTAILDISCPYAPHITGVYTQLEKDKNINNHPVWELTGGQTDILLHTSSKGAFVFSENGTIIARSKKPHRSSPVTSQNISWMILTQLGEWCSKKIAVAPKKKPVPAGGRISTTNYLKSLVTSAAKTAQNKQSQHVSLPVRRRPQSLSRSPSEETKRTPAIHDQEALDRHLL